jgi:tetratricopeptide (TPR) repeat protein
MSRYLRLLVLFTAIVALPSTWVYAQPAPAATPNPPEVTAGLEKMRIGDIPGAVRDFDDAARKHPEYSPGWIIVYNIYAQQQDANKARAALEEAVTASPTDPEAYVLMGNLALQERRTAEADLLFEKSKELLATFSGSAVRKKVLDSLTISGLASVAEIRKKWDLAEKQLAVLLQMEPKNALVMQRLARATFGQKQPGKALTMLREAKKADPANVLTPEAALAGFYEQYPDHPNAVIWYDKALQAAPDDLPTHRMVAIWALETGDIPKAKAQAIACLKLDPSSLEAMLLRGVVALYEEDFNGAEDWFQQAHLKSPGNFAATNNLALALCEEVDPVTKKPDPLKLERALGYANTNYQANPRSADACSTLGWVLFKKNDLDQATMALRQAAQAAGGNLSADTAYYLASVLYARLNKDDAKKILEQIIRNERPFSKRKAAKDLYALIQKDVVPTTSQKSPLIP